MSECRLAEVEALFHSVVDLPAEDRKPVLAERCGGDEELRAFVERLLANHDSGMGEFLESPFAPAHLPPGSAPSDALPTDEPPTFAPGERVAKRYRVERLLGRGGMGEVYEALDEELEVTLALKALRLDLARQPGALRRLKQEVLLARSIIHLNVCRVYDLGRHEIGDGEPVWFLTMELLRGETLGERLRQRGSLGAAEALPLVEQMAAGLGAAHRAGVVHLDFKSGNVMLVRDRSDVEDAVVTDFGQARMAGATIEAETGRMIAGTPAYMAPEQVQRKETGPAADIYALGVVLYEMMTGKLPFAGRTPWETARRRLEEVPPPPRSVVPDLDERWEKVILRCLAPEPRERFARAEDVVEALRSPRKPVTLGGATAAAMSVRGPHTLPPERDAFVGREAELEALGRRLAGGSRLVTLLGPAGMGKTRLAVRHGWQSLGDWPGGVWFCDLTEARSANGILSVVGGSLAVPLAKGDPVEQLGRAIAGHGRCLVILDNFEQVVSHAVALVGRWLAAAEDARFLVTSRERLKVRGEELQVMEPLDMQSGVQLFLERARRQHPGFEASGSELESVREVVRFTEGMPLAIELAAARMRVMTAGQVAARMQERLKMLAGAGEDRHGSLRAAIEGSWELLTPWEQSAWAQCTAFEGGFTLEAAESVLDLGAWPEAPWVVDVVQSLVDKSLLRVGAAGGGDGESARVLRFGMYASLREYARMKPRERGPMESERAVDDRHGRWFARYGTAEALEELNGVNGVEHRSELEREIENLITACRRAIRRGDGATAAATYQASWAVLELRGPLTVGVELGREVLASPLAHQKRAKVLSTLGQAEGSAGETEEARVHLEAALAIARDVGNRRLEGVVHLNLGSLFRDQGRKEEARASSEAALAIARERGDRHLECSALLELGFQHLDQGLMNEARTNYEVALAIAREVGDRQTEAKILRNLGILHTKQGRFDEARDHFKAVLAGARDQRNPRLEAVALGNLGLLHIDWGLFEESRPYLEAALATARAVGDRQTEAKVLNSLGILHSQQGRKEEARSHFEASLAIHRRVHNRRSEASVLTNLGTLLYEQLRMGEARAHHEEALAIEREVGNRAGEGMLLGYLGNLHLVEGRFAEADACYEAGLGIAREVGDPITEGTQLGNLSILRYRQGRIEEAREALVTGEAILRRAGAHLQLGILLSRRAELEGETGNAGAGWAAMSAAEAIYAQAGSGPDSELGRLLAKLRQGLAASS